LIKVGAAAPGKAAGHDEPGPVESIVRQLYTSTPGLIDQAAAIDKATRQIFDQAARQAALRGGTTTVDWLNAAADTKIREAFAGDLARAQRKARTATRTASPRTAPEHDDPQAEP
jgi:hypothetical protein